MGDGDDEDDYMSDAFINKLSDVCPGLNKPKIMSTKLPQKVPPKIVSIKSMEREKRQDGLNKPLSNENKGYSLLLKMGYTPGQGLGKLENGRSEPVPIDLTAGRSGLGRESAQKRKAVDKVKSEVKRAREIEAKSANYRDVMSYRFRDKEIQQNLYSAQKVCHTFDTTRLSLAQPERTFYWPIQLMKKECEEDYLEEVIDEEENLDDNLEVKDQLDSINEYLRVIHLYCIWCSITYSDEEDLNENCPGFNKHDH